MRLVYVFVMVLYLFVYFQKTSSQSNPAQRKRKKKGFSKDKRPSSTVIMVLMVKKLYRVDICDRNTSSIACNEHNYSNSDGPTKNAKPPNWPNVEPMLWPKDGPMSKR